MASDDDLSARRYDQARTLALSDGVFAISLTLLVLSITFPRLAPGHEDRLAHALWDRRNEMLSWLLSFLVVALMWLRHHALFAHVRHVDGALMRWNFLFLGGVAFLPYPTQVLGAYGSEPAAVALYAVTLAIISGAGGIMTRHALATEALTPAGVARFGDVARRQPWWVMPLFMLLAFPASFVLGAWGMLVWLVPNLLDRARRRGSPAVG